MTGRKPDAYFQEFLYLIYENVKIKNLPENIYIDILRCLKPSNGKRHNRILYDLYGLYGKACSNKNLTPQLKNLCECGIAVYNGLTTKYHLTDNGKEYSKWLLSS